MRSHDTLVGMYYRMVLTRHFNNQLMELKAQGKVYGPIHRSTGQEAIGIGVGAALRPDDVIISNHRGFAHWIGKGIDLRSLAAEIFGKAAGCCKGKGGEMLITDWSKGILSTTIIGGGLPTAAGLGLAFKLQGSDRVVVCFFGDGASNTGAFHESLNFAAMHKLPVIYLCENNQWGLSVRVDRSTSVRDIAMRALAYHIDGIIVDGNDVLDVLDLVENVSEKLRSGHGPVLIEAKTYRLGTFSSNDRATGYQPEEDLQRWAAKCPIKRFGEQLQFLKITKEEELVALEQKAEMEAREAIAYGQAAAYPEPSALYEDLFVQEATV